MWGPVYDSFPHGRGLRAQIIYLIDVIARLVVSLLILWFVVFVMLRYVVGYK
jgi:glycerol-3-phosphate acyltransferase PlsY